MNMFRNMYPLRQFEAGRLGTHDIPPAADKLHLLAQHGSLGATLTRHFMLQFTNAAARDHAQILALADQARRHAGLRTVNFKISLSTFESFRELVADPDLDRKLDTASQHPESKESKQLLRRILPLLQSAAEEKPWEKHRRACSQSQAIGHESSTR